MSNSDGRRCLVWVATLSRGTELVFLGSAGSRFSRPGLSSRRRRAQPRSRMAAGHREAARSVLDGGEPGARLCPGRGERGGDGNARHQPAAAGVGGGAAVGGHRQRVRSRGAPARHPYRFRRRQPAACPSCGAADCPAYDTEQMSWRHLDFFQHQAFLHARVPRVHCISCGVKKITVTWAREGSGFTLLFEALIMSLVPAMPLNAVARSGRRARHQAVACHSSLRRTRQREQTDATDLTVGSLSTRPRPGAGTTTSPCLSTSTTPRSCLQPTARMPKRSPSSPSISPARRRPQCQLRYAST